ncbi:MAG TPA: hypothetical protein VF911_21560 [Thermoanaerobaculia bacterium]|jgi:hypothetical protein
MLKTVATALIAVTLLFPARASALETGDLLSLVAMPLAVAAVSQIDDVPVGELMDVVALLNNAAVPPPQFIEVIRHVPVALIEREQGFVDFLRVREREGVRGTPLVASIEEEFRVVYSMPDVQLTVTEPRTIDIVESEFGRAVPPPPAVRKAQPQHPRGGPPGQLKKAAGTRVVTQVVAEKRNDRKAERKIRPRKVESRAKAAKRSQSARERVAKPAKARGKRDGASNAKGSGNGRGGGNAAKGKGKGKG